MIDTVGAAEPTVGKHRWVPRAASVLALALLAVAAWWITQPSRFRPVGNQVGMPSAALDVPVLFGAAIRPSSPVTLRAVRPRVRDNTAVARIRVIYCAEGPALGISTGPAEEACQRLLPISGERLGSAPRDITRIAVEVTPRRPGRVVIDGFDVSYRAGWRWGSESTGIVVTLATAST